MGRVPDVESIAKMEGLIDSNESNELDAPYFSDTGERVKEVTKQRDDYVRTLSKGRFTRTSIAEIADIERNI
jgi:hypothetical protein